MPAFRKVWKGISVQKGVLGRGGVKPAGCKSCACVSLDPGSCGCCCACSCCSCCNRAYNC